MSGETPRTATPVAFPSCFDYQRPPSRRPHSGSPLRNEVCQSGDDATVKGGEGGDTDDSGCSTIIGDERSQRNDSTTVVDDPQNFHHDSPYSNFNAFQKKNIIILASLAAFLSPLSSQIYLPATQKIADEYHESNTSINLTMTLFIIMQGIVPTFVAGFSDNLGRRPVYLICFPIYIAANIGLALQRDYSTLLALRCLQGVGSSAATTLANAIVADLITSAERGTYMGFTQIGSILGPAIGPVLGGVISQYADWRYIFWLLALLAGVTFIPLLIVLPETCRRMVGDGSLPAPIINKSILELIRDRRQKEAERKKQQESDEESQFEALDLPAQEKAKSAKLSFNPLASLIIMWDIETALLLFCNSFAFACFVAVTTSIPAEFHRLYHLNQVQTSLIYIPLSLGTLISAASTGQLINWNFKRHARRLGYPLTRNRQHDLDGFPVEKARLQIAWPLMLVAAGSLILYGWIMHLETDMAAPIVVLFIFGYTNVAAYKTTGILLVDIHAGQAATVSAASNLIKSGFGAAASAAVSGLIHAMGIGWTFTALALVWVALSPCFLALMVWGPHWRKERREREEKRRERKNSQDMKKQHKKGNITL